MNKNSLLGHPPFVMTVFSDLNVTRLWCYNGSSEQGKWISGNFPIVHGNTRSIRPRHGLLTRCASGVSSLLVFRLALRKANKSGWAQSNFKYAHFPSFFFPVFFLLTPIIASSLKLLLTEATYSYWHYEYNGIAFFGHCALQSFRFVPRLN
jgi:hypothetical protein